MEDDWDEGMWMVALDVAKLVGSRAAPVVERAWGHERLLENLVALARASAACLAGDEAYDRVRDELAKDPSSDRRWALQPFERVETLDWIEERLPEQVDGSWGRLAAWSRLDWARVVTWFELGRPFSLVALDALKTLAGSECTASLANPPDSETLAATLDAYLERDDVLRVSRARNFLMNNSGRLTN